MGILFLFLSVQILFGFRFFFGFRSNFCFHFFLADLCGFARPMRKAHSGDSLLESKCTALICWSMNILYHIPPLSTTAIAYYFYYHRKPCRGLMDCTLCSCVCVPWSVKAAFTVRVLCPNQGT